MKTYEVTCYDKDTKQIVATVRIDAHSHAEATRLVKIKVPNTITSTDRVA